ncbi:hypothetical protein PCANC_11276 [Puccinia coronata f. sp. avenae]|uniref:Uncharacterized protein n=1 Tax=Puccinia coronata f. sp. avenae TaxID=200324 RepID=A0A2N5T679_9BASI|nr:hypothetical protein PCANC_11276 [Puccinia coronata f. sp. avenae]
MLFLGYEPFSDAARFFDPLTHWVVITRDFIVPTVEVDQTEIFISKDLKYLPSAIPDTVQSPLAATKEVTLSTQPKTKRQLPKKSLPPQPQSSSDNSNSNVLFNTEATKVIRCGIERWLRNQAQNVSVATARPNCLPACNSSNSEVAPNQGRHFQLPPEELCRLR